MSSLQLAALEFQFASIADEGHRHCVDLQVVSLIGASTNVRCRGELFKVGEDVGKKRAI